MSFFSVTDFPANVVATREYVCLWELPLSSVGKGAASETLIFSVGRCFSVFSGGIELVVLANLAAWAEALSRTDLRYLRFESFLLSFLVLAIVSLNLGQRV